MYRPAFFQVWWWLHGDCPGRRLSPCAEASRGFRPADVPRQRPEGEALQHTAVSAPIQAGSVGQHFQPVHQASAEAGHRGLLCVPDHPGSGEAPNMGEWKNSGFFFQTLWINLKGADGPKEKSSYSRVELSQWIVEKQNITQWGSVGLQKIRVKKNL